MASARAAVLAGAVLATAGCSVVPVEENTFESSPLPAITADGAMLVLAEIDEALTAADTARDPALMEQLVGGLLLQIDAARYALDAVADPDDVDPAPPVDHLDPTVFIPRFADYPQWFVGAAATQPDGPLRLEVLARDGAGAAVSPLRPAS